MSEFPAVFSPNALATAVVSDPLMVTPETKVADVIAQMSTIRSTCTLEKAISHSPCPFYQEARASCVLVMEDGRLIGIFTERDVVRLSADSDSLKNRDIRSVMTPNVITLRQSEFKNLLSVLSLLQQHHIRHIPVLDEQGAPVGLLTYESLRRTLRPIDLLRLRTVGEVMATAVVCAFPDTPMLAIAQLMHQHRVSSVVIVQPGTGSPSANPQIPLGIVTERDVVQLRALATDFTTCLAQTIMSAPVFAVGIEDTLWSVQQIMEQHFIHRLVVVDASGHLQGIVTQTSLLQMLNPVELFNLAEILRDKVSKLEAEKVELLENRTQELQREVETRTTDLRTKMEQERLIATIATQIRLSRDCQSTLANITTTVR